MVVIGVINRLDIIDLVFFRLGRFDRLIFVLVLDEKVRFEIFKVYIRRVLFVGDVDFREFVKKIEGYMGVDIVVFVREVVLIVMCRIMREFLCEVVESEFEEFFERLKVLKKDFEMVMKKVKLSVMLYMMEYYRSFEENRKK